MPLLQQFQGGGSLRSLSKLVCGLSLLAFAVVACDDDDPVTKQSDPVATYDAAVVRDWMDLSITFTKETPGFTPPVAARAWGYVGLACYESLVNGMNGFTTLAGSAGSGGQGGAMPDNPTPESGVEYHWPTVANAALAQIMTNMYAYASAPANNATRIDAMKTSFEQQFQGDVDSDVFTRSQAYGKLIAERVYTWSQSDGGHEGYLSNFPEDYVPPSGDDGLWIPTPPGFARALQPYWDEVRVFAENQTSVTQTDPGPPPAFSLETDSQFYIELIEVYDVSQNLTQEQRTIAEYWSDDPGLTSTPPGHSMSILMHVLETENSNLSEATEAFAKLGMSLHDAFVSCWASKYKYNLIRPISCIRRDLGHEDWLSIVGTPPFPEYTSGHSVQSGAMSAVMSALFGANYSFTDDTHATRVDIDGSPRSFASFDEAAEEAALSRLYGGIHYRAAIELGVDQGREVGAYVLDLFN